MRHIDDARWHKSLEAEPLANAHSVKLAQEASELRMAAARHGQANANRDSTKRTGHSSPKTLEVPALPALQGFLHWYQHRRDASEGAAAGARLAKIAAGFEGQQLWQRSKYRDLTPDGRYGCATSASELLQRGGYDYANSPTVGGLVSQLRGHGWTQVPAEQARPGDVMVGYVGGTRWRGGHGSAHIGIVGEDGKIWNNSKRQGNTWVAEDKSVAFDQSNQFFILRPPQRSSER